MQWIYLGRSSLSKDSVFIPVTPDYQTVKNPKRIKGFSAVVLMFNVRQSPSRQCIDKL